MLACPKRAKSAAAHKSNPFDRTPPGLNRLSPHIFTKDTPHENNPPIAIRAAGAKPKPFCAAVARCGGANSADPTRPGLGAGATGNPYRARPGSGHSRSRRGKNSGAQPAHHGCTRLYRGRTDCLDRLRPRNRIVAHRFAQPGGENYGALCEKRLLRCQRVSSGAGNPEQRRHHRGQRRRIRPDRGAQPVHPVRHGAQAPARRLEQRRPDFGRSAREPPPAALGHSRCQRPIDAGSGGAPPREAPT